MKEGDIILSPLVQADGVLKNRPVVLLRELPPFGDYLVCGISTQLHQAVPEFDEVVSNEDSDFNTSGLFTASVIRLSFLALLPRKKIIGSIGAIAHERHQRLLTNLSKHLVAVSHTSTNQ